MTRKREKLQAYFAGLFDGEGVVDLYWMNNNKGGGSWSLRVAVNMTDPRSLGLLHREYPEAKFYAKRYDAEKHPTYKPYYVWSLHGRNAERFLSEIKPYVILKQDQVKLALTFLAHQGREHARIRRLRLNTNVGYSGAWHKRTQQLADKMKRAKLIPSEVNSVNLLLSHGLREYRSEPEDVEQDVKHILSLLEGVETSGEASAANKPNSASEKEIVQV
jgi:hypothetical protein